MDLFYDALSTNQSWRTIMKYKIPEIEKIHFNIFHRINEYCEKAHELRKCADIKECKDCLFFSNDITPAQEKQFLAWEASK